MAKRVCVKEDYTEIDAGGCAGLFRVKKWVYTYSDGTTETVAVRIRTPKPVGPANTLLSGVPV